MLTRLAVLVPSIAAVLACSGVGEKAFPRKMAAVSCDKYEECDPDGWAQFGSDKKTCKDELKEFWTDYTILHDDCTYDKAAVTDCVDKLGKLSCTLWNAGEDECTAFYVCDPGAGPSDDDAPEDTG